MPRDNFELLDMDFDAEDDLEDILHVVKCDALMNQVTIH